MVHLVGGGHLLAGPGHSCRGVLVDGENQAPGTGATWEQGLVDVVRILLSGGVDVLQEV